MTVATTQDSVVEAAETFTVNFTGAQLTAAATATVTITDDDVFVAPAPVALTTQLDNRTGSSSDDTFSGTLIGANADGTTAQAGDVINGGAGTDTFNLSIAGATTNVALTALSLTGVETVSVSNFDTSAAGANDIDTSLFTGVTTLGVTASSAEGDTTFTNVVAVTAAQMKSGSGDLTLSYTAAAVAGTADVQSLALQGLTAGTFTANGTETIAITSELVKSKMAAVASDKLKAVTITGNQDLEITTAIDFVAGTNNDTTIDATINATAFTGKLSVGADENDTQITGGSGDDTFKMGAFLTKNDKINGGAGKDTITMAAASLTDQFAGVSSVEVVAFDAGTANATLDIAKLSAGVTTVQMDLSDATDGSNANITGNISNLNGQTVVLKHTVANAADTDQSDGVAYTITNAIDTAADTVNITLDAIGVTSVANNATSDFGIDVLSVANFETVNLESKKSTTVTANQVRSLTDTLAKTLNITGDADLTITQTGTALTALNASALDGKLNVTLGANKVSVTGTAKDDTFVFAGNLNNDDTVVGGAGKDTLTASVNGLNVTTGKLNTSGVEIITLTTGGDNTLDLTNVVGATSVSVSASTQTITGLNLATKIIMTDDAILKVTAANATGADDTLIVERRMTANADETNTVEAKGGAIENLAIILNDQEATAVNTTTYTLTDFEGKKVTVTQSEDALVDANVALGTLHKNVLTVDSSAVKGTQAFSLASATAATTVSLGGAGVATVTGSAFVDTFNIGSTTSAAHAITGGDGTDIVNITLANTNAADFSNLNVERVNITVAAGADVSTAANENFHATVTDITLRGGNAASTYTQDAGELLATTVKTFDASTFGGNILLSVANDVFDDTVTITGGVLATDAVTATYATAGTYKPKTAAVEILKISAGNNATAENIVLDLSNSTGVTTVEVDNIATTAIDTVIVDKITNQKVVVTGSALSGNVVEAKLTDATGSADAATIELKAASTITGVLALKTTDIETINIKADVATNVSLANVSITEASKFVNLNVTGNTALTISALNADVNVINASGMGTGGSVVQTGRSGTTAATYTGSAGADTFIMANAADALNAGSGTDTLSVNFNAILGGIQVDLSSTTDQVTALNGSANAAIQVGFENVNLSGYTGTYGADITAAATGSVIAGTANVDQITLGTGNAVDKITLGLTSSDTVINFDVANRDIVRVTGFGAGNNDFAAATAIVAGANAAVTVATTALANDAAIVTAIRTSTDTTATLFVVLNTADAEAQLWFDADPSTDGGEIQVATLSGITSLAGFAAANFEIVA